MAERADMAVAMPWHTAALQALLDLATADRLPHALLLAGSAGIGKVRMANALAQALLCQSPSAGLACGNCRGCHLTAAGSHPDLFHLRPDEGKRLIRVDQVRELVEFCARTAQYDGYRVALVQPAEAMNRNAQNALLKTLEEPGRQTLLILVADQPSLLLPTVRSRCQLRQLPTPEDSAAMDWLSQQVGQSAHARALLNAAAGAPLRARALDSTTWFADRAKLLGACVAVVEGRQSVSSAAAALLEHDTAAMLAALFGWIHQAATMTAERAAQADEELLPLYRRLRGRCERGRLLEVATELMQAHRLLLQGNNPNAELLFEQMLLRLAGVDAVQPAF